MTLVRAAFLIALSTPILGLIAAHYVMSAFDQSPHEAMIPVASVSPTASSASPTARPRPTATQAQPTPTSRPRPTSTARPVTQPTQAVLPTSTAQSRTSRRSTVRRPQRVIRRHAPAPSRRSAPRATAAPLPTWTAVPTAIPVPSPTTGTVVLARYWIGTTVARRGSIISVGYVIANGTGRTEGLSLGASIKPSRALDWATAAISDPRRDVVATVPPGTTIHARYFAIPATLRPGLYDVAWGLRNAAAGSRVAVVFSPGVLRITR